MPAPPPSPPPPPAPRTPPARAMSSTPALSSISSASPPPAWAHVPPALLPPSRFRVVPEPHSKLPRPRAARAASSSFSSSSSSHAPGEALSCATGSTVSLPSAVFAPALWALEEAVAEEKKKERERERERERDGERRWRIGGENGGARRDRDQRGEEGVRSFAGYGANVFAGSRSAAVGAQMRAVSELAEKADREADTLEAAAAAAERGEVTEGRSFTFTAVRGVGGTSGNLGAFGTFGDTFEEDTSDLEKDLREESRVMSGRRFLGLRRGSRMERERERQRERQREREKDVAKRASLPVLACVEGGNVTGGSPANADQCNVLDFDGPPVELEVRKERMRPFSGKLVIREAKTSVVSRLLRKKRVVVI